MASASSVQVVSVEALVDKYLEETLGIHAYYDSYSLLKTREGATKREIELATRAHSLYLHPDKARFQDWVYQNTVNIEQQVHHTQLPKTITLTYKHISCD
jgi:hypothetical protein